jgi:hypothetical protein
MSGLSRELSSTTSYSERNRSSCEDTLPRAVPGKTRVFRGKARGEKNVTITCRKNPQTDSHS